MWDLISVNNLGQLTLGVYRETQNKREPMLIHVCGHPSIHVHPRSSTGLGLLARRARGGTSEGALFAKLWRTSHDARTTTLSNAFPRRSHFARFAVTHVSHSRANSPLFETFLDANGALYGLLDLVLMFVSCGSLHPGAGMRSEDPVANFKLLLIRAEGSREVEVAGYSYFRCGGTVRALKP